MNNIQSMVIQKIKEIENALKAENDIILKYDKKNDIMKIYVTKTKKL